jgi:hypothetical protein
MPLPITAVVDAAPSFLKRLPEIHQFFREQDLGSADARLARLKTDLQKMVEILGWSPGSGRPARFSSVRSAQGMLYREEVQAKAVSAGVPMLREYIVGDFVVLYAHSEKEVVLLSLRHQRQLRFSVVQ